MDGCQGESKVCNQKLSFIIKWNGFIKTGKYRWTDGIYEIYLEKGWYILKGNGITYESKFVYEFVEFLLSKKICIPCPINSNGTESYFNANGFVKEKDSWIRGGLVIKKRFGRNNEYIFKDKIYTFSILKKKLKEYGIKEINDVLITGRINDL